MSSVVVRLPESMHRVARKLAKKERVSVNQLITLALSEKISASMLTSILRRAPRSDSGGFSKCHAQVPTYRRPSMIGFSAERDGTMGEIIVHLPDGLHAKRRSSPPRTRYRLIN